jgi:hypothetical protein
LITVETPVGKLIVGKNSKGSDERSEREGRREDFAFLKAGSIPPDRPTHAHFTFICDTERFFSSFLTSKTTFYKLPEIERWGIPFVSAS